MRLPALALLLLASGTLQGQAPSDTTKPAPYSRLRIRLSGARNVNRDQVHDFWRAGTGGSLAVTTPFYVGSIGLDGTLIPFWKRDPARPNLRVLLVAVDWGSEIPTPGPLRVRASARVGDFVMAIENPNVRLDTESELFVGAGLSAAMPLWKRFSLALAGSYAHVYTRPTFDLAVLTIGLEYATRTPRWLRTILE
jgi:hypothetical protein